MELNFYTLCVIYLVYSFLGWVAETVAACLLYTSDAADEL